MTKKFKFLRTGLKSEHGNHKWKIGQWYSCDEELDMCNVGFHCSKGIYQAFSYVQGEYLAEVEVKGKSIKEDDKEVWEKMQITKVWKWKKEDSVLFSIYAARLVLKYFEQEYPDDDRPRKAIEAAEEYIKHPTKKNQEAAAEAAWAAARAAARAAAEAAWAAWAAARAAAEAAWAAWAAARAAAEAAEAAWAAEAEIHKKLDAWMLEHLTELEEYKTQPKK